MSDSLKSYEWQLRYCSSSLNKNGLPTDVLHDFYIPALERATRYDRVAGYFRSSSLAAASQGYTAFLDNGGRMRLIVGADLQLQDVAAILQGNRQRLSDRLMAELAHPETWPEEVKNGVALLGGMVASKQLDIRIAFRTNPSTGQAIAADSFEDGYVHEKWFVMADAEGNRLYGSGSLNESRTALILNAENIDIHCDWEGRSDCLRVDGAENDFADLWDNRNPHMKVLSVPEAVVERLICLKDLRNHPTEVDGTLLATAAEISPEERLRFAVLRYAPQMPDGEYIGMYSAPVRPWPHQEIVSRRLIESWPYSYMMCDEVGLGKTIEAALAIRSLVLCGRVKRVLIVAPAVLTEQWHRELAQKAMLPFALSRVKPGSSGKFIHSYIYGEGREDVDDRLYSPDLNIVSSGLARRQGRLSQLRQAADFDIVLVDEAHYARRKNPRDGASASPKYGDLYKLLQMELRKKTKSLWLATATPMQIAPIETYDLFCLTNRVGQFQADPTLSMEYFGALGTIVGRRQLKRQGWAMLGQSFLQIEKLDPYLWATLETTAITRKNQRVLNELPFRDPLSADIRHLIQPMFAASPLSRVMMRHTRALLELYRRNGQLSGNLANRHVRPVCAIEFTPAEAEFYVMLEDYCKGLGEQIRQYNPDKKQVMFFLLNFLQLRFASSFYAIERTMKRRLRRVKNTLLIGYVPSTEDELKELLDELKGEQDEYGEDDLDDITMDALLKDRTKGDLVWEQDKLSRMLEKLNSINETPSKMQALFRELDRRRQRDGRLRQTVLFTRFYDTLCSIRTNIHTVDPDMRIGIYAGGGKASRYDPIAQKDTRTTHEDIKKLFLSGEIDLLLCTDAAAEGLNLQTADLLINFDLGWNPMKIEQRIGRIDRIGQKHSDIEVINMCYLGSTEQLVYGRLLDRLKQANLIVGTQQLSLLPVTQEDFRKLQAGEITLEQLENQSKEVLQRQKEATASMEMSAEDMYQMYSRMSQQMHERQYPATLEDLWSSLVESGYLKESGAQVLPDGRWSLPASDHWEGVSGFGKQDDTTSDTALLSWSNPHVNQLLSVIGDIPDDTGYLKRIVLTDKEAVSGIAVATTNGIELVTAFSQLNGIEIDTEKSISAEDERNCERKLANIVKSVLDKRERLSQAEKENTKIAALHSKFLCKVTINILQQFESRGCVLVADIIKQIESGENTFRVELPPGEFGDKASELLFMISPSSSCVYVTVNGILLSCVLDLIKREANGIRGKNSEKRTADVIHRLERR